MKNKVTALRLPKESLVRLNMNTNKKILVNISDRYDFLPVVKINGNETSKNAIISLSDCTESKTEYLNLGSDYDKEWRNYPIANIVIAKNSIAKVPLLVKMGYDPIGPQDGDGVLEFRSSNASVRLNYIDNDDTDYDSREDKYDLKDAEYGDEFVLEIDAKALARGTKFSISVYASDDSDGWGKTSGRKGICGKFNVKVVEKDVFLEEELKKGFDLLSIISQAHRKQPKEGEYSVNYCMQGADRFLGAIVENQKDFYTYDDKNGTLVYSPNFTTAIARAKEIKALGYGLDYKEFGGNIFGFQEIISGEDVYGNNPTRNLFLRNNNGIYDYFKLMIKNKRGIHIFYLSIVDALHTLFVIVDNKDLCNPTYKIYDEDGESSSKGSLKTIGDGILKQSQWVYTWTKSKLGYWAKLNVSLLKFQRK
ncbi:MAG: hypothetical protein LBE36_06870 [Flavobacteriaceae bacterium]|jgi:hypothetical protein|nr:hypothetical protein [Flavobacteriaceae bacterium]